MLGNLISSLWLRSLRDIPLPNNSVTYDVWRWNVTESLRQVCLKDVSQLCYHCTRVFIIFRRTSLISLKGAEKKHFGS